MGINMTKSIDIDKLYNSIKDMQSKAKYPDEIEVRSVFKRDQFGQVREWVIVEDIWYEVIKPLEPSI